MKNQDYKKMLKNCGPNTAAFLWYLIETDENPTSKVNYPKGTIHTTRNDITRATTIKRGVQFNCENQLINLEIIIVTQIQGGIIYTINYSKI